MLSNPSICDVPRFAQRFDPAEWAQDGFLSPQDSAYWSERSCGIACVRMMLAHQQRPLPRMSSLLHEARAIDGYSPRGWIHAKLATLMQHHGSPAQALPADIDALRQALAQRRPAIVSVTQQLPQDGQRGGHLIVLAGLVRDGHAEGNGLDDDAGQECASQEWAVFRDPSGWGARHQRVPLARLLASYTGRAILPD